MEKLKFIYLYYNKDGKLVSKQLDKRPKGYKNPLEDTLKKDKYEYYESSIEEEYHGYYFGRRP